MRNASAVKRNEVAYDPWLFVAEIEHRIANEYAMAIAAISRSAARQSHVEAKTVLAEAAQRLRNYADAHRSLRAPVNAGPLDLSEHLRGVCSALSRAMLNERGIGLTLVETAVELSAERCWRVGLIVAELVTNAARHGFKDWAGTITVEIIRAPGEIHCRVCDNGRSSGPGIPGHGAALVDALAGQLGGSVERRFTPHGGAVLLSFPQTPHLARTPAFASAPIEASPRLVS
jgi:two-component sensor histidine kinase